MRLTGGGTYSKEDSMGLKDSPLLRDLDRTIAVLGIMLSVLLIVSGGVFGRVLYLFMGILVLFSCFLWLKIRNSHSFKYPLPESRTLTLIFLISFFVLYILSVLSVHLRPNLYERPLLYFILTALMAGIVACEILVSGRRHTPLILFQVILLGVSIAWSQLLIFPGLLGIDPWFHAAFTDWIVEEGSIQEGSLYSKLPYFHLMIAATSLISALPYKFATMASVSLGQIVCNAFFVFLLAATLFKNYRVGLLSALLVVTANHHIRMSYWSIPNAFAALFILMVVYLAFSQAKVSVQMVHKYSMNVVIIVLMAAIVLTHPIAAVCMALLLFAAWVALTFYRVIDAQNGSPVNITLLVPFSFVIVTVAWWTFASGHMQELGRLIKWGFSIDYFGKIPAEYLNYATSVPPSEQIFNNVGMYLFFAVSAIGLLYMISRRGNGPMFIIAWIGVTPLLIAFLSLVSGYTVIEDRWWYFAQILLSVPLAVAILLLGTWRSKRPLFIYCFVFGSVLILSFFMIMSVPANIDNHIFSPVTGSTYAYSQSERVASDFFAQNSVGTLSSDRVYCTNPSSSIFTNVYGMNLSRLFNLDNSLIYGEFDHDGSIKILRSKLLREPLERGGLSLHLRQDMEIYVSRLGFNRIYHNSMVSGYIG